MIKDMFYSDFKMIKINFENEKKSDFGHFKFTPKHTFSLYDL